ncbi:MAG: hypothetical protein V1781_00115 [Bacteroidota bacterium]
MKQIINIILLSFFIFSCNKGKNDNHLIDGKWRCEEIKNGCEIAFKNGLYNLTKWNDDLVNTSNGKYFLNENKERLNLTLTLVPDLQYSEGDTIMLPCENIDLVSITDSVLITQKPTQWVHGIDGGRTKKNVTTLYKKIK